MLYHIHAIDRADAGSTRADNRAAHLDYLRGFKNVVLAGAALNDDGETPIGSVLVVNVASRAEAEAFSAGDPFTKAGLFGSVSITRMRKAIFSPEAAEGA